MSTTQRPSALTTPGGPEAGRKRFADAQREEEARRGRPTDGGPRPLEFDEAGFPVRQANSSFGKRVARLLNTL